MAKKRICLDPGHYGSKYNAGTVKGYFESAIVWRLTMYEKEFLEKMGIEVVLTRHNMNEDVSLVNRGLAGKGCDLIVSNHTNACGTPSVTRAVVVFMTDRKDTLIDNQSKEFATKIAQVVDKSMGGIGHQVFSKLYSGDRDGDGLVNDNYYGVIHGAFLAGVPGVIVEHGFHTNAGVCEWLMNDHNLRKLAKDCARCMAEFVGVYSNKNESDDDLPASTFKDMTRDEVLEIIGPMLTENQKKSGILASVTGAQLILESDGLQSELAQNANNCHGMKAELSGNTWSGSVWNGEIYTKKTSEFQNGKWVEVVAKFRKYTDIEESMTDHSAYLVNAMKGDKKRYAGLVGCTDHRKAVQIIKDGGYASDPNYVDKILGVIEDYDLKRFDCVVEEPAVRPDVTPTNTTYPTLPFIVCVNAADVEYYAEPNNTSKVNGTTGKGSFTIVEMSGDFGKLKSGAGWIYLGNSDYYTIKGATNEEVKPDVPFVVRIDITNLNIRKGPGTNYDKTGRTTGKGNFTIVEVKAGIGSDTGWGKLKSGAGWISLDYAKRV